MSDQSFRIIPEEKTHAREVETLLDLAFGPGRFAKSTYRLREGVEALEGLSFVGMRQEKFIATIRFWPVLIGTDTSALMLGPLAVDPAWRGKGWGLEMIAVGLATAKNFGHDLVILVGDETYYARQGFKKVPPGQVTIPGPCDPQRLLYHELVEGSFSAVNGIIAQGR